MKFNENPSSGIGVHADGQTRRTDSDILVYDEANRRFTQFC